MAESKSDGRQAPEFMDFADADEVPADKACAPFDKRAAWLLHLEEMFASQSVCECMRVDEDRWILFPDACGLDYARIDVTAEEAGVLFECHMGLFVPGERVREANKLMIWHNATTRLGSFARLQPEGSFVVFSFRLPGECLGQPGEMPEDAESRTLDDDFASAKTGSALLVETLLVALSIVHTTLLEFTAIAFGGWSAADALELI